MKKKLAFLLAVVLVLTSMLGLSAAATEASAPVIYTTVPMRATVSILYAVKADTVSSDVKLIVTKAGGAAEELTAYTTEVAMGGAEYYIFEYSNLNADEMGTDVTVYVDGWESSAVTYSVADFLNKYVADHRDAETNELDAFGKLAAKMLAYGEAVYAYENPVVE